MAIILRNPEEYLQLMRDEKATSEDLEAVKELLETASSLYYNTDEKLMGDQTYDDLRDEYTQYGFDLDIGAAPSEGKGTVDVDHSFGHLVGSLGKRNTIPELHEWLDTTHENSSVLDKKIKVIVTLKYDGNSAVGEFKSKKLIKMLTRGRNGKGMDLTHVFKDYKIPDASHVGVKFEVIMTYENYEKLMEDTGASYANPRSTVAGKLGDDDAASYAKYFTLVPLGMSFKDEDYTDMTKSQELRWIDENFPDSGIKSMGNRWFFEGTSKEVSQQIKKVYDKLSTERFNLPFMIDGLVIEFDDARYRDLGVVSNKPKWAIALKFPYMEKESKVIGFEFDYGNTGRITPMVLFDPVVFNGAEQKRVSLANYKRFRELKLGIGSDVLVQYRNDTLSYVEKLDTPHNKTVKPYPFITKCPVCGSGLSLTVNDKGENTFAYCGNDECEGKIVGRIERYLTKLDFKGIKASTIEKLHDAGLVNSILDMYTCDLKKIPSIDGLGKSTADLLKKLRAHKPYDYEILGGLGIHNFGNTAAKSLCSKVDLYTIITDYEKKSFQKQMTEMEGFNTITVKHFTNGMDKHYNEIAELYNIIDFKEIKPELEANKADKTYTIVITGKIEGWANRDELKKILEMRGHKVAGSVSANTDFLVNNDVDSTSGKNKKAKDLGIEIIDEVTLKQRLGL
jgi:DNA ligase (NAD+)